MKKALFLYWQLILPVSFLISITTIGYTQTPEKALPPRNKVADRINPKNASDSIPSAQTDSNATLQSYQIPTTTNAYPVLYGIQSREKLVQSVGYLNGKQLEKMPAPIFKNTLAGQLAGLQAVQFSGEPRSEDINLNLRGKNPLLIVDGIPRDILSVSPEQIESVTVLKDALSTAMLGMRGMNGAILVTTRKKAESKGSVISFTAQTGVQAPINLPQVLSAYDYARLFNEALVNDRLAPVYSQADLDAYQNGTDPIGHPNVDWQNTILKKNSFYSRYSLNTSGSYTNVNYFVSVDYLNQDGLLKENAINPYSTNIGYQRYLLRSNLQIKLDSRLTAFLNISGNMQNSNGPGYTGNNNYADANIFGSILNTPRNAYPVFNPDGSLGGNQNFQFNTYGLATQSGYVKNNARDALADIGFKRELDDVLPGLWAKATMSYNMAWQHEINRSKVFESFQLIADPATGKTSYQKFNETTDQSNTSSILSRRQQSYFELAFGYDKQWNKNSINVLLLANRDNYQFGDELTQTFQNASGRWVYSFDDRYIIEAAGAFSGNNRYTPGSQAGFFPAAGLAWNIHNEPFWKENIGFVNQLKVRASYGKVGNADPGYYLFQQKYGAGSAYFFGTGATNKPGTEEKALANPYRTWEKANKFNAGLDMAYSQNRGWFSFDYYNNRQYDLLQVRGHNSGLLGTSFPEENIGENKYYGIEVNTGWADKIGKANYYISGNISTQNSKVLFIDEVNYPYEWMQRTGNRIGQTRGYIADGFFNASNLTAPTIEGYLPVQGDIRYKDLNNDGIINQFDQTAIGNKSPLLFYGLTMGLQLKSIDLSILLQGVANRNIYTTGPDEYEFLNNGSGQAYAHHLNRWTPETASSATYPRLTVGGNVNNQASSSFWVQPADFMRLKNAELGYTFSSRLLSKVAINSMRLFLNGQNLFTISKFNQGDPEANAGLYPLQRVINGGITVKF